MKLLLTCCALCLALCLTSCNTIKGAGEDIKGAGSAIEKAAQKTKDKIAN